MTETIIEIQCIDVPDMNHVEDTLNRISTRSITIDGQDRLPVVNSWRFEFSSFSYRIWADDRVARHIGHSEFLERAERESVSKLPLNRNKAHEATDA